MSHLAASSDRKKQSPRSQDVMSDRCPKHPDRQIEFSCSKHQQLFCGACVLPHQKQTPCDDVSFIADIAGDVPQSEELQNTLAELKELITTIEAGQAHSKRCQQQMEASYDQLIEDIKQFRQTIYQHIDKLTVELFLKASKLRGEILQSHTSQISTCDSLIDEMKGIKCDVDKKCDLKQNNQLFIALKSIKSKIQTWEIEANNIIRSAQASRFIFHRNAQLEEVTTVARLGTVSVKAAACPASAKFLYDINIKLATDKMNCCITGIAALADGRLAATDSYNNSVKLVDTAARKVTESISLTSRPEDITVAGGDQLAVVLCGESHIQLLNLTPKLSLSHTLRVPGCYVGITYSEGNYILACSAPVQSVHICDKSGRLLHQIQTNNTGSPLFKDVEKVAVSPDQSTIYISDRKGHKVVSMNRAGVVMETYRHDSLRGPEGLAVVDCGCVLVCCVVSLLQLGGEGSGVKVLLGEKDGLVYPCAVANRHNTIYISSWNWFNPADRNNIQAFTLEP